jgi:hypothetical protein
VSLRRAIASARLACEHMRPKGFIVPQRAKDAIELIGSFIYTERGATSRELYGDAAGPSLDDIARYCDGKAGGR